MEKDGKIIKYYPNGKIGDIRFYKNGEIDGIWEKFWENGNKDSEILIEQHIWINHD